MPWTTNPQWDLESIFPGGIHGSSFLSHLKEAETNVLSLLPVADKLGEPGLDNQWDVVLPLLMAEGEKLGQLYAFTGCHAAVDTEDTDKLRAEASVGSVWTKLSRAWTHPTQIIGRCSDTEFDTLITRSALADLTPMLIDMRATNHLLLPPGEQELLTELSQSALQGWNQLYDQVSGALRVDLNGETLSQAQVFNMGEVPEYDTRQDAFDAMVKAWEPTQEACALALNHLTGTRSVVNRRLGVDELATPLARNRISSKTLDVLMDTCVRSKPVLWRYLQAKARLLGKDKLGFAHTRAPIGASSTAMSYSDAQDFVVEQFSGFSGHMASFAEKAFSNHWVEAEDRSGKRHGAFCTGLPLTGESRVFMTFSGRLGNILTLAHELGHAYHNEVLVDVLPSQRRITSSLAETASTFAEALVRGGLIAQSKDDAERLALLDQELQDAAVFLLNIPVRFEFERALYEMRAKSPLSPKALTERMLALQKQWYGPALGQPHPLFWAEKLHFYIGGASFYNFPYTFGYLFSGMVYSRAMEEGPEWATAYEALLRDTGAGPAETTVERHLGKRLDAAETWTPALKRIETMVGEYEQLAKRFS